MAQDTDATTAAIMAMMGHRALITASDTAVEQDHWHTAPLWFLSAIWDRTVKVQDALVAEAERREEAGIKLSGDDDRPDDIDKPWIAVLAPLGTTLENYLRDLGLETEEPSIGQYL